MRTGVKFLAACVAWNVLAVACSLTMAARGDEPTGLEAEIQAWTPTWYPPGGGPETDPDRRKRWAMVAEVLADLPQETDLWPQDQTALVATIWKYESSLDFHVHGGDRSPIGHQDRGTSRCLGQIKHVKAWWTLSEWTALAGRDIEATRRCAAATLRVIGYHVERCKLRRNLPEAARWRAPLSAEEAGILLGAYGTGSTCTPALPKRVKTFMGLREALL